MAMKDDNQDEQTEEAPVFAMQREDALRSIRISMRTIRIEIRNLLEEIQQKESMKLIRPDRMKEWEQGIAMREKQISELSQQLDALEAGIETIEKI